MDVSEVREYFEDNGVIFNPFQVEIDSDLHYVSVASRFPDYREKGQTMTIEVACYCETIVDFINFFHLESVEEIDFIRHETLYALYEQGDAEIVCGSNLYLSRVLYFRKQGRSLFARTEDFVQHKVNIALMEPDDYIGYAKNYLHSLDYSQQPLYH